MAIIDHEAELHRAGANITGLLAYFTRGPKFIIEETFK